MSVEATFSEKDRATLASLRSMSPNKYFFVREDEGGKKDFLPLTSCSLEVFRPNTKALLHAQIMIGCRTAMIHKNLGKAMHILTDLAILLEGLVPPTLFADGLLVDGDLLSIRPDRKNNFLLLQGD